MVEWTKLNTRKINRVGYNKNKKTLYIDFKGSETDTIFLEVPEEMYDIFIKAKSPDKFYDELVKDYFDTLSPGIISSANGNQSYRNHK